MSLLSVFCEEDEDSCRETAGALGRAEAGGVEWAGQAEAGQDVGEVGKAREPSVLLLTDVDLRGLEFSEEVGPSVHPPPFSKTHRPHTPLPLSCYHGLPTNPTPSLLAVPSQVVAFLIYVSALP